MLKMKKLKHGSGLKTVLAVSLISWVVSCATPAHRADSVEATREIPSIARDEVWTGRITGRLAMRGDCLTVRSDQTGDDYLLIWSNGSRFDGQRVAVVSPQGREKVISVGARVRLDGSHRTWDDIGHLPELHRFRASCNLPLFFVVQAV